MSMYYRQGYKNEKLWEGLIILTCFLLYMRKFPF